MDKVWRTFEALCPTWHLQGEERVVYSFAHVTAGKRLTGWRRFKENVWDAVLYFGPSAIFQKNY